MPDRERKSFTLPAKCYEVITEVQTNKEKRDRSDALEHIILMYAKNQDSEDTPVQEFFKAILGVMSLIGETFKDFKEGVRETLEALGHSLGENFEQTVRDSTKKNPDILAIKNIVKNLEESVQRIERERINVIRNVSANVPAKELSRHIPEGRVIDNIEAIKNLGL